MCLTSSRSSSSCFWALDKRVSPLFFSACCHSSGLTLEALYWSISSILVLRALDLAIAAYFCSSMSLFSLIYYSLLLITVASLILASSVALMITASCWLLVSVFFLIPRSSSRLITLAPVFWAVVFLFPKRDSSTYEFPFPPLAATPLEPTFERWLALDPIWDYSKKNNEIRSLEFQAKYIFVL